MDAATDSCYHGDAFITDSSIGLNNLLVEYLKTLTDVCKIGILLAGKLDQGLKEVLAGHHVNHCSSSHFGADRRAMSRIGSFYSNILTNMGPLWQQTMFECSDDGNADESNSQFGKQPSTVSDHWLTAIDWKHHILSDSDLHCRG